MKHYFFIFFLLLSPLIADTKFLSYNVWFDDSSGVSFRYQNIIDFISNEDADYVCLQEVTPIFLQRLQKSFSGQYYIYNDRIIEKGYGLVILSKKESSAEIITLTTKMGREALVIQNDDYTLVNVHLESMMDDTLLREQQLSEIKVHIRNDENSVICGDFNFGDEERENGLIESFTDTGEETKKDTYDIYENRLAQSTRFPDEPSRRLDRILIPGSHKGTFTFKRLKVDFSDHYPISVKLKNKM